MRVKIPFADIRDAFDFVSFGQPMEHEAYLCRDTGTIYYHSEVGDTEELLPHDIDDPEKYIAIPHKHDFDLGEALVCRFAEDQLPEALETVRAVFGRRGAYRRFKDLLESRALLQQWYHYEEKATDEALREWCEVHGIAVDD